jgi:3-dehydroquinate synthase
MTPSREVAVTAGGGRRNYSVVLGRGLLDHLPGPLERLELGVRRWAVVSDTNVGPLHGQRVSEALHQAGVDGSLFETPAGEEEKTRRRWEELTDRLLAAGFGRDAGIMAVGGGVVGDLAGFVAATYMRGIPVVQVPTSLLAMIDASVGGKTGVDTEAGKNLVGAFHPPSLVVVDPGVVSTLPGPERAQGLVEAVKHGAILDEAYGTAVARASAGVFAGDSEAVERVVHRSVELKAGVVSADEREAGIREVLNFGHTVGHALERVHGYRLPHGTAVAQGMLWEARLGESLGITEAGTTERLQGWLESLGLPLRPSIPRESVFVDALKADKKVRSGEVRVVLLERPGRVAPSPEGGWAHRIPVERIVASGGTDVF